jgi:hypothetical protein
MSVTIAELLQKPVAEVKVTSPEGNESLHNESPALIAAWPESTLGARRPSLEEALQQAIYVTGYDLRNSD